MRIVAPFLLGFLASSSVQVQVEAFQTSRRPFVAAASTRSVSALNVVGPEHVQLLQDSLNLHHVLQSPALVLLSDAAEAVVKEDTGWWASYLQIFKGTLQGVHDVIDPPLRSAGITQTWGISIFLFTAGKFFGVFVFTFHVLIIHSENLTFCWERPDLNGF
jgi:hypothetical protein